MPNDDLAKFLTDTGPYQAAYKPVQNPEGGNAPTPARCNIPAFDETAVEPDAVVVDEVLKDCILDFVPLPLVPTPYLDVSEIITPCGETGFVFESDSVGAGTIATEPAFIIRGTGTSFVSKIKDYTTINGAPWPQISFTNKEVGSVTIASGGSNYTVNDIITVSGGTFAKAATLKVLAVSGNPTNAITNVQVVQDGSGNNTGGGSYTSLPSNPAGVTGGTGTGATFNLTLANVDYKARVASVASNTELTTETGLTNKNGITIQTILGGAQLSGASYKIKRISFTSSNASPTGGFLNFIKTDPDGCTGLFVGEINIAPVDINNANVCNVSAANTTKIRLQDKNISGATLTDTNFAFDPDAQASCHKVLKLKNSGGQVLNSLDIITPELQGFTTTYITTEVVKADNTSQPVVIKATLNTAQVVDAICTDCCYWG